MKKILAFAVSLLLTVGACAGTFPLFQPSNGVLKGNVNTYVTTPAASSDIITLWSGTCNSSTYLRADGTCQTVTSGTVTSVGLSAPSGFTVTGSPVTGSGTLAISTTLSGPLKGTGSGFTTAASSDIVGLWSGTCDSTTFLRGDGSCQTPAGGGTPGGADTNVQYNNAGAFGGSNKFTWSNSTGVLNLTDTTNGVSLYLNGTTVANSELGWVASGSTAWKFRNNYTDTFDLFNASGNSVMNFDNLNNRVNFRSGWDVRIGTTSLCQSNGTNCPSPTVTPAGSDTQIQYNDAGALGASSEFTWTNSTKTLLIGASAAGSLKSGNNSSGTGYALNVTGGSSSNSGSAGGVVTVTGGTNSVSGAGGAVNVFGGNGTVSGAGGAVTVKGGGGVSGAGGLAVLQGGTGNGSGNGGNANVTAGNGGSSGNGGSINLTAGSIGGTAGNGGSITLTARNGGSVSGNGGDISLTTGTTTTGTAGAFTVNTVDMTPVQGTFSAAFSTGCTTTNTYTVTYIKIGKWVTLFIPGSAGCTSNTTTYQTSAALPAALTPSTNRYAGTGIATNNGGLGVGCLYVQSNSVMVAGWLQGGGCISGGWTGSGNKDIAGTFTYPLN